MDSYIEHEYLIPIVIGCHSDKKLQGLLKLLKLTKQKIHLFAPKFSFFERFICHCHKVEPFRDEFLVESLLSFASSMDEYYFPVIFINCDETNDFVLRNTEQIESAFVTADLTE